MNKSVYSIVLADEVVEAIDRLAYSMNTSRSNLINQILAERVSLMTPEMRMREIFSTIEQLMDSRFQFLDQPSDSMISIKSPVKYKYKPTIRYSVELSRDLSGRVGRLKVQFRTQSVRLIQAIGDFFSLWNAIESKYLADMFNKGVPAQAQEGRYVRDFYSPDAQSLDDSQIAQSISQYINTMDSCVQLYFDGLSVGESRAGQIEREYRKYLNEGTKLI